MTRAERLGDLVFRLPSEASDLFRWAGRYPGDDEPDEIVVQWAAIAARMCDSVDKLVDDAADEFESVVEFPAAFMLVSYVGSNVLRWRNLAGALCDGDLATYFIAKHVPAEARTGEAEMNKWNMHKTLCELRDAKVHKGKQRRLTEGDKQAIKEAVRGDGLKQCVVAERFGVNEGTISRVLRNSAQVPQRRKR